MGSSIVRKTLKAIKQIQRLIDLTFADRECYRRFRGGTWWRMEIKHLPGRIVWDNRSGRSEDFIVLETKEY
jgi:hypothetical protein